VPTGAIADQHGMAVSRYHCADVDQVLDQGFGVDRRHDDSCPHGALGANCTEQMEGFMAVSPTLLDT
jgi:hypothetical protein